MVYFFKEDAACGVKYEHKVAVLVKRICDESFSV